jgi:CysZ protein
MRFAVDAARGFQLAFQGVSFLGRHRVLWKWAIFPTIVNVIVFAIAFALFLTFYPDLYALATGFLHLEAPQTWYAWLWVAPLRLFAWGIGLLLLVTALVVLYFAFLILGTMIAAPFLDILAQRVEALATGRIPQDQTTLLDAVRNIGISIIEELRKLGFFLAVQIIFLLLGLIPVLTPFTVIMATLFTILFLPLEYAGFAMDHRQLRFRQRRALIWQHRWLMLGFGAAAFLTLLIPFLNFICLSILVIGGTLLILDTENTSGGRITRH